jgi:cohesin complex subunit SA-1/2
MDYIIALSCTLPRVYRQVASFMGLSLLTSYITITNMLGKHEKIEENNTVGGDDEQDIY